MNVHRLASEKAVLMSGLIKHAALYLTPATFEINASSVGATALGPCSPAWPDAEHVSTADGSMILKCWRPYARACSTRQGFGIDLACRVWCATAPSCSFDQRCLHYPDSPLSKLYQVMSMNPAGSAAANFLTTWVGRSADCKGPLSCMPHNVAFDGSVLLVVVDSTSGEIPDPGFLMPAWRHRPCG